MDKKFFEELLKNAPAKITAESDDKGKITILLNGRGIDVLSLALAISDRVIEQSPLTVDDFCGMLKKACTEEKKQRAKDVENAIISKLLSDIFK